MVVIYLLLRQNNCETLGRRAMINVALMIILHAWQSVSETALMSVFWGAAVTFLTADRLYY